MINFLKNKYYLYNNYFRLKHFFRLNNTEKILLFGYPKSGNTWFRFIIYNYYQILNNDINVTISYDKLNSLQENIMDRGTTFFPKKGYPFLYRTHKKPNLSYKLFDYKIFIHRNPLDTLVSSYYFYKNRSIPFPDDNISLRNKLYDINFYVCYKLKFWLDFYYTSKKISDLNINYSEMRRDTLSIMLKVFKELNWKINQEVLEKAIFFSSFDEIQKMGRTLNQMYGNGPKDGRFVGEFTRSGNDGQFNQELSDKTINYVLSNFSEFSNLYPNLIE